MSGASLTQLLAASAARHRHLCPRQVLGVRIGLLGASTLGLDIPRMDKRLLTIIETDGCFADGIEVTTGCTVGHRTLRIEDYGKIAATFVDAETERAIRITPQLDARQRAFAYADGESRHYFAQLLGYQRMPDAELLSRGPVYLNVPLQKTVSRAALRVQCDGCGEEIFNERQLCVRGRLLCHTCAQGGYYAPAEVLPSGWVPRSVIR